MIHRKLDGGEDLKLEAQTYSFFARKAREAGMTVSAWMQANGIIGSAAQSRIDRNEVSESVLPEPVRIALVETTSWGDDYPGGQQIASIVGNGMVKTRAEMPKRKAGRPRERFYVVDPSGE